MRDPDLVVRAQQAATALESAWRRWREMHGLGADPVPPVSSYVGYSLEAPWGQARIVLGICAEEAEQLAALLERHDCVGPVHASVTAKQVGRPQGNGFADTPGQPGAAGILRVPAPAPASAGQQPLSAESAFSRQDHGRPELPSEPRRRKSTAASELTKPFTGSTVSYETPIARAASRAVEASMATRKNASSGSSAKSPEAAVEPAGPSGSDHPGDGDEGPGPAAAGKTGKQENTAAVGATAVGAAAVGATAVGAAAVGATAVNAAPVDATAVDDAAVGEAAVGDAAEDAAAVDATAVDATALDATAVDATAVTAAGGLSSIPAIQPFPWAASLTKFGDRERVGDREAGSGSSSPGIVAFRPRPETGTQPATRGQSEKVGQPGIVEPGSYRPSGHQPNGHQADGRQADGRQADDRQQNGHQPVDRQQSGHQPNGHQPNGHQPVDHQLSGHQPNGQQANSSQAVSRQQGAGFPGGRDEAATQLIDGELARASRALRGPAFSTLQRPSQAPATDRAPAADVDQVGDQGLAGVSGWPQGSRDRISTAAANAAAAGAARSNASAASAANADPATWAASELPGPAAVTDTAV
jgi:hypothetical protein